MKFIYADPGLVDNLGHHANSCRMISTEVRARAIPCSVLSFQGIAPFLQAEVTATPWFRRRTYGLYHMDHISGWLNSFQLVATDTEQDFARIEGIQPTDILYLNSAQPPQFRAITAWAQSLPDEHRPTVILEFGTDSGLTMVDTPAGPSFQVPNPIHDPRALLYRYTSRHLTPSDQHWLRLATFEAQSSAIFQSLLDFPVETLPTPHQAVTSCRHRAGQSPVTISFLGHQRRDKGIGLVPELAVRLLSSGQAIRILVHNGNPEGCVDEQARLRAIADRDPRLILNEQVAGTALWSELLEQSDIIVCPYHRNRFISSYSAVATEAIANAIPLVVPAGTTMEALLQQFDHPGVVYVGGDDGCVEAVLQAVLTAIASLDALAHRAKQASLRWQQTRGVARLVDTLLAWHSRP